MLTLQLIKAILAFKILSTTSLINVRPLLQDSQSIQSNKLPKYPISITKLNLSVQIKVNKQ